MISDLLSVCAIFADNQQPEVVGYSSSGQQLAQELEEVSSSRRSTLRRHYTVRFRRYHSLCLLGVNATSF